MVLSLSFFSLVLSLFAFLLATIQQYYLFSPTLAANGINSGGRVIYSLEK